MDRKYYVKGATPYLSNILWERSSVWLERMPVTHEVASSSLVVPAIKGSTGDFGSSNRPFEPLLTILIFILK